MSESEVRAQPTVRNMVHQLSLNSNGSSETDSNEIREDEEITLDQADAWGFGGRGASQAPAGVCKEYDWGFGGCRASQAPTRVCTDLGLYKMQKKEN